MPVTLNYGNLDQFRPGVAQAADLEVLRGTAKMTGVVEWGWMSEQRIWTDLRVMSRRSMRSAWNKRGRRIRARYFRAVRVHPPGLPVFWYVIAHMPPKRMWGALYIAYARRLRKFIQSLPGEKVVFADWNRMVAHDPCRLRKKFGGALYGTRIDGCWVSPGLVKHIDNYWEVPQPERKDNHPFCYLTMGSR